MSTTPAAVLRALVADLEREGFHHEAGLIQFPPHGATLAAAAQAAARDAERHAVQYPRFVRAAAVPGLVARLMAVA